MGLSAVRSKLRQIFSNTYGKIILILILPSVIMLVFLLCNNLYHLNSYKSILITNYSNELNTFLIDSEESLDTIISSANFISINRDIGYALTTETKPSGVEIAPVIDALQHAKNFSELIDSIAIYNRTANFVVTPFGMYDAELYFNTVVSYANYPASYWFDYRTITGSVKTLPPTTLVNDTSEVTKTIVPFVFTSLEDINSNNIIIFNISVDTIFDRFETYKLTPNTQLYMIDNSTANIYTESLSADTSSPSPQVIASLQSGMRSHTDIVTLNGEKYLSICSTQRSNIWGYTYMVTIPYTDINRSASTTIVAASLFMLALSVILILYTLFGTRLLYSPWKKLVKATSELHMPEQDSVCLSTSIEEFLKESFSNMAAKNKSLEENLSVVLPLGQEKYLIDILNDNCTIDQTLAPLSFQYDYFVSVSINISINPLYFTSVPEQNAVQINTAMRKAICSIFSSYFLSYELPGENNIIYLLLNLENDTCSAEIQDVIEQIRKIIEIDKENVSIAFGVGNIYQGLDGLKLTHQESISNLIKELASNKIQFSAESNSDYIFTASSEGVLINYLMAGQFNKATEFLNNIYKNIAQVSSGAKKQAYSDIISALKKFIRQRGLNFSDDAADYMLDMLKTSKTVDDEKFQSYINEQLTAISSAMQTYSSKVDITAIISYINEHYTDNIGLEELAEQFGSSAKYLSRRIGEYLNMPFKKYLTSLRIEKAKEALETTDITVSELYSQVGFQNRSAFINAFKLNTGLTPSEYRKTYRKKARNL